MRVAFFSIVSILFAASWAAWTADAREPAAYSGIIVQFRPGASAELKQRLHREAGARLSDRLSSRPVDIAHLEDAAKDADRAALKKACRKYLAHPEVVGCELNVRLKADGDSTGSSCPPPRSLTLDLPDKAAPDLVPALKAGACNPFLDESGYQQPEISWPTHVDPPETAEGKLPPFWNRQMTGADLVKDDLDQWDGSQPAPLRTKNVDVGILDAGTNPAKLDPKMLSPEVKACTLKPGSPACDCCRLETLKTSEDEGGHGTSVMNLIAADPPLGDGPRGKIRYANSTTFAADMDVAVDHMNAHPPKIVNMSMHFPWMNDEDRVDDYADLRAENSEETRKAVDITRAGLQQLGSKTIMVYASGNEYPAPVDHRRAGLPGIFVASCTPNGLVSDFSSDGPDVAICAPSDRGAIRSDNGIDPGLSKFGGTSGAAPQVTGALSNVLSLLPELTTEEAKKLLKMTAIHTAGYRPPDGRNGAGALNAYKMIAVAQKLKAAGWPSPKIRAMLDDPATYELKDEESAALAKANLALASDQCGTFKQGVKALRQAYFLDPNNEALKARLAELYRQFGYEQSAQYLGNQNASQIIDGIQSPSLKALSAMRAGLPLEVAGPMISSVSSRDKRLNLLAYAAGAYKKQAWGLLDHAIGTEGSGAIRDVVRGAAGAMADADAYAMYAHYLSRYKRPPGSNIWEEAKIARMDPNDAAGLLMDAEKRLTRADWARLAAEAEHNTQPEVRAMVAMRVVFDLPPDQCRAFLTRLSQDPDAKVRENAADLSRCDNGVK